MIYNRYNKHHKVLEFLNKEYFEHHNEGVDKYCFSLEELSKKTIQDSLLKSEKILTELRDYDCVNFRKTDNSYKISDNGVKKYKTQYFLDKQKEYYNNRIKGLLSTIVSVLAIITFFITVGLRQTELNKSHIEEMKDLQYRVEYLEHYLDDNKSNQINLIDTVKTDFLHPEK